MGPNQWGQVLKTRHRAYALPVCLRVVASHATVADRGRSAQTVGHPAQCHTLSSERVIRHGTSEVDPSTTPDRAESRGHKSHSTDACGYNLFINCLWKVLRVKSLDPGRPFVIAQIGDSRKSVGALFGHSQREAGCPAEPSRPAGEDSVGA